MSIFDDVSLQMKEAMRAREQARVQALRNIRAAFLTEMKKDGSESLSDEACVVVLRRLAKQRGESIAAFEEAGRPERAAAEAWPGRSRERCWQSGRNRTDTPSCHPFRPPRPGA
jgi:uncharacterized protein YqeY